MSIKKILNYSPNFDTKKREINKIKFLIFHYTGMKKELESIKRLTNIKSKVSSHYLIKKNGDIVVLVPDLYVAWHAGKSSWKKFNLLNNYSIGIEISNPGHGKNYKKFSKRQTISILKLSKHLIKKYKIKPQSILGHSDISPSRKKDPGEKFPWELLAKKKLSIWHKINQQELKNLRKKRCSKIEKYKFSKNLIEIGYSGKNLEKVTKAFQRRFRSQIVDGKIDQECFKISKKLI